jgi:cytochrome c-type biogenesis protein
LSFDSSSLAFIFTAGALALFSPCGFPMLPGYISYYMGAKVSMEKALAGAAACTLGLLTVFSAIGVIVSTLGRFISQYIPLLELAAGLIVVFLGISMIFEIRFPTFFTISTAPTQKGLIGVFLYGVAYGLATLGCSAPIFFSILFYAVAAGGSLYGIITFVVYAIGMGLPITITTIFIAKAKKFLLKKMMKMLPWLQKIGGLVLITIGAYLIYYHITF